MDTRELTERYYELYDDVTKLKEDNAFLMQRVLKKELGHEILVTDMEHKCTNDNTQNSGSCVHHVERYSDGRIIDKKQMKMRQIIINIADDCTFTSAGILLFSEHDNRYKRYPIDLFKANQIVITKDGRLVNID